MHKLTQCLVASIVVVFFHSVFAADYPANIDYGSKGDFLAKRGVDKGRTTTLSMSGPILINTPLITGSSKVGITPDFTDSAWDISDPTNPQLVSRYNCFEDKCYLGGGPSSHSHMTTHHEGKSYLHVSRHWRLEGPLLTHNSEGETSIDQMQFVNDPIRNSRLNSPWRISHLTSPYDTINFWEYHFNPSAIFQIRDTDRSHGVNFAEWDHIGLTGVTGFPIFLGNLLVFASDQQQTGMAIYDISGMLDGKQPRLITYFNPDLNNPVDRLSGEKNIEKLGGYWADSYGTNKIVWSARMKGTPRRSYPSMFVVDITDPINPYVSCELYFSPVFDNTNDSEIITANPMYVNFQDEYAYVDNYKVNIPACEAAYADDKRVDPDEFADVVYTFDNQTNSCGFSQYFRPLGQLGVFGGGDSWQTTQIIEHDGGNLELGDFQKGTRYNVFRDATPGVYRSGTPMGAVIVGRNLNDSTAGIFPTNSELQVGDTLHANQEIINITGIREPDERINEQGMCFFVTSDEPDTKPPYISGHMPRANQANVPVDSFIHFHIPETLRGDTLSSAVTIINTRTNTPISFRLQSMHTGTVSIFPDENLAFGDQYRVDIAGVQDFMGNTMLPYSFSFTTGNSPYQAINTVPLEPAPEFEGVPFYPNHSGNIACDVDEDKDTIWVANPDNGTVSVIEAFTDESSFELTTEISESHISRSGSKPTSVTKVGDLLAVTYADDDRVRYYRLGWWGTTPYSPFQNAFKYGSHPIASVAYETILYVALYNSGEVIKIDTNTREVIGRLAVGPKPKAMALTSDGSRLLVTRFISNKGYAEVYDINTADGLSFRDPNQPSIRINKVLVPDDLDHGSGVPNYLRSIVIGPNDDIAYVTANKANIDRGLYVNGQALDDDNTIRPMIAVLDLVNHRDMNVGPSTREGTIDLDNSADPAGLTILPDALTRAYALQGNNIMVFDHIEENSTYRASTGFAPQSLCATERNLYVKNRTDRTVTVLDIANYMYYGTKPEFRQTLTTVLPENEVKTAQELRGLQVFYHASPDVSPEGYISCASCHDDGGHDGMTWDLTQLGEGLRNTLSLRGTSGTRFGHLHWSANFDEVQDFEVQIEQLNGGEGLIPEQTFTGDRTPLSHITTGESEDLDDLAAYINGLGKDSVLRSPVSQCYWGGLCGYGSGGWQFFSHGCKDCHSGPAFRDGQTHNVGTITAASGQGAGQELTAIRTPTLIELWDTAPYLHDGSAATLEEVFEKGDHANMGLNDREKGELIYYLKHLDKQFFIDDDELFAP